MLTKELAEGFIFLYYFGIDVLCHFFHILLILLTTKNCNDMILLIINK